MQCVVYKSLKQFDYYLYVKKEEGFTRLPEGLQRILGALEKVIDLELDEQRTLARVDVIEVMQSIEANGYFLQMPPRNDVASPAS